MSSFEVNFQIGKNGLTQGVIDSLDLSLKDHERVRISVLKSSGRDRDSMKLMAHEICDKVSYNCTSTILGFTIILKRQKGKKKYT